MNLPEAALYYRNYDGTLHPLDGLESNQNLPILKRIRSCGRPCYIFRGEKLDHNRMLYGVSHILKLTQKQEDKEALKRWELSLGKDEANQIRQKSINAGNLTHSYLDTYLKGNQLPTVSHQYKSYIDALDQLIPYFGGSVISEQLIVNFRYRYIGRVDQFGLYKDKLTLSDLKTSLKPKRFLDWIEEKACQLAAYYISVETLYPVEQAALIYLISDGSYNEYIFTPGEMTKYKEKWFEKLSQFESDLGKAA